MFIKKSERKKALDKLKWSLLGLVLSIVIMSSMLYLTSSIIPPEEKKDKKASGQISFRDGDVVFQRTSGELSDKIKAITGSPFTHCGLIVIRDKEVLVLEAGDQVQLTPVKKWVRGGVEKKFALTRPGDLIEETLLKITGSGKKLLGRPYDYKYGWDDENIYCSELIYKSFKRGAGIELCPFVALKDLNYQGHEDFIRKLMDGKLPLDRKMIIPVDVYRSRELKLIYSDFKN